MANYEPKTDGLMPPWRPGQSGNPKGRPKKHSMKAALDATIDAKPEILQALISKGIQEALKGDFRFWREIFERLDGKVPTPVDVTATDATGNDFITITPTEDQPSDGATDKVLE